MKFDIKNRYDGSVIFTADIECSKNTSYSKKLGLAVKAAVKQGANLSDAYLSDAYLSDAYLSGAYLSGAYLRDAYLSDADLSGTDLSGAYLSGAYLSDAYLSDAYLSGAYLSGADLSGADLSGANLSGANLSDANLSGADLGGCPVKISNIHQAVYAAASKPGCLNMSKWHSCGTTHCRAGWVIELAGDAGKALEWVMGTPTAAAIIYMASDPDLEKIPDFYCGNEKALADMKRLAELEKTKNGETQNENRN